jgi:hypothetical protein
VVVGLVAFAIVRPWADDPAADGAGPTTADATRPAVGSAGTLPPGASREPAVIEFSEGDLFVAAARHAEWGVRAIVLPAGATSAPGMHALEDRWMPIYPDGGRPDPSPLETAVAVDEPVLALGVTTPPTVLALDIRWWRIGASGIPRRVVPLPVAGPDPASWLWRPNPDEAAWNGAWVPGRYVIDVLTGPRIVRLLVIVPGAGPDDAPVPATTSVPADLAAALRPLPDGAFAIEGGEATAVRVTVSEPLDARRAWLEPGTLLPKDAVGRVTSTEVGALGVILPPGAWSPRLGLRQVTPVAGAVVAPTETITLEATSVGGGRTALVALSGPRPFASATYRLTVTWTTSSGERRAASWHVEVVPRTPPTPPGLPLDALDRWTGRAVIDGATNGEPIVTDLDRRPSSGTGTCGPNGGVTTTTALIGLALPPGDAAADIRLIAPDGTTQLDTRAMLPGPDGLALLALDHGGTLPGTYRIEVRRRTSGGIEATSFDVCIREAG